MMNTDGSYEHTLGKSLMQFVVEIAEFAMQTKSYGELMTDEDPSDPTGSYAALAMNYRTIYYATWVLANTTDSHSLNTAIENLHAYHMKTGDWKNGLNSLMPLLILANRFDIANTLYRTHNTQAHLSMKITTVMNRSRLLWIIANYRRGEPIDVDLIIKAISYWYFTAADWSASPLVIDAFDRVTWFYLYSVYVTAEGAILTLLRKSTGL